MVNINPSQNIDGVILTSLEIIPVEGGNVLHAMKNGDTGFSGFGEAYFSSVEHKVIKGWKRHFEMILNIAVPIGHIRFILFEKINYFPSAGYFAFAFLDSFDDSFKAKWNNVKYGHI